MAEQQFYAGSPGPESEPLHPSLGNPGDRLYYVPDNLGRPGVPAALKEEQALAIVHEAQEGHCSAHSIVVAVPPSVVHTIFAHRQWRSGMICADLIYSSIHSEPGEAPLIDLAGKRVLELGAGTALPSVLASRAPPQGAPAQIVITDYDESELIDRLRANVKANIKPGPSCKVNVQGHVWGTNPVDLLDLLPCPRGGPEPKFDAILLADCLWDSLSHADLLLSLSRTLAHTPSARVYVTSGLHTGRDTVAAFIRRAEHMGLGLVPWLELCSTTGSPSATSFLRRAPSRPLPDALGPWTHVLEAELAPGADVELDTSALRNGAQAPTTVSCGRRLTGRSRPFVGEVRPEEARAVGGVMQRNRWILAWAMAWAEDVTAC